LKWQEISYVVLTKFINAGDYIKLYPMLVAFKASQLMVGINGTLLNVLDSNRMVYTIEITCQEFVKKVSQSLSS
jgi:hypothetical protein